MNETTGDRLRQFAIQNFGSVTALCEALKMTPQGLYAYISNRSKPGSSLQEKLRAVGCDIEWLMTGVKKDTAETTQRIAKTMDEREVYIRVLEIEVRSLREKVQTYEQYLHLDKEKDYNFETIPAVAATPPTNKINNLRKGSVV